MPAPARKLSFIRRPIIKGYNKIKTRTLYLVTVKKKKFTYSLRYNIIKSVKNQNCILV